MWSGHSKIEWKRNWEFLTFYSGYYIGTYFRNTFYYSGSFTLHCFSSFTRLAKHMDLGFQFGNKTLVCSIYLLPLLGNNNNGYCWLWRPNSSKLHWGHFCYVLSNFFGTAVFGYMINVIRYYAWWNKKEKLRIWQLSRNYRQIKRSLSTFKRTLSQNETWY